MREVTLFWELAKGWLVHIWQATWHSGSVFESYDQLCEQDDQLSRKLPGVITGRAEMQIRVYMQQSSRQPA